MIGSNTKTHRIITTTSVIAKVNDNDLNTKAPACRKESQATNPTSITQGGRKEFLPSIGTGPPSRASVVFVSGQNQELVEVDNASDHDHARHRAQESAGQKRILKIKTPRPKGHQSTDGRAQVVGNHQVGRQNLQAGTRKTDPHQKLDP